MASVSQAVTKVRNSMDALSVQLRTPFPTGDE
jgi:hypothetical protein